MHFVLHYPPVRPTFPVDITEEEKEIMNKHIAYWTNLMNQGHVLVFGPVLDPKGVYGLGIVEADREDRIREYIKDDPAVQAGLMRTEFHLMNAVVPAK